MTTLALIWDAEPTAQATPCRTALLTRSRFYPETMWIHAYAATSTVVLHYITDGVIREIGCGDQPGALAARFNTEVIRHKDEGWTECDAGVWSGDPWDVSFVAAGTSEIPF